MSPRGGGILLLTKHLHFVQSCKISSGYSSTASNLEREVLCFAGGGLVRRGFFRKSFKGGTIRHCICVVSIHHTHRAATPSQQLKENWWQLVSLGGVRQELLGELGCAQEDLAESLPPFNDPFTDSSPLPASFLGIVSSCQAPVA